MTGPLVFNPGQMGSWAGALRDIGGQAGAASSMLFLADTTGLPPDIAGEVEGEVDSLRRILLACEATLDGSGGYLNTVAARVRQSDSDPGDPLGLKLVKGVAKVGPAEAAAWGRGQSLDGTRVRGLAGFAASLTGVGALEKAVKWSEWAHAVRTSGVHASASRRRKLAGAIRRRMAKPPPIPRLDARADNMWRKLGRGYGRLVPVAGAASSYDAWVGASRRFQADEPQTGIAQVAIDVRDLTALAAASYNLEAEVPFLAPVAKPIGYGLDAVVLSMDTGYSVAKKGHDGAKWLGDQAVGGVKDLGRGLAGRFGG
jgi:hypothetical protein